jgi:hypothetical protein
MKNIHVLPTEKPSRLWLDKNNNKLHLDIESYGVNNQNIYITNSEKIKKGDWFLNDMNRLFKADKNYIKNPAKEIYTNHRKIILTDNKDLIADGVQAIDDEFLEWFVKNPSCEEVKIINFHTYFNQDIGNKGFYKIIIPKEEPKQETLEEFAERLCPNKQVEYDMILEGAKWQQEQDKKLYSEEEVLEILREFYKVASLKDFPLVTTIPLWFEKFKKK